MDIKKEREAFELWAVKRGMHVNKDGNGVYFSESTHRSWEAWQAAKAQVHEGFVLVPKEPTGKMISAGYESKEHINNLIVNYKAMIEAAQGEGHE